MVISIYNVRVNLLHLHKKSWILHFDDCDITTIKDDELHI